MAKKRYPAIALIKLMEEAAEAKGYPPTKKGVTQYSKELDNNADKEAEFEDRYVYSRYLDYEKLMTENAFVSPRKDFFDFIAKEAGYEDLHQYLEEHHYEIREGKDIPDFRKLSTLRQQNPPAPLEWIDQYIVGARILPTFLGVLPLFITLFFVKADHKDTSYLLTFGLIICFGLVVGLAGWVAILGKWWEYKLFFSEGKPGFPTTYLMLFAWRSKFSTAEKQAYREKVTTYFGISFPLQAQETKNKTEAIQKLREAGMKVRNAVKTVVIRSALIRYGLLRNLVPASLLALFFAVVGFAYGLWQYNFLLMICMMGLSPFYLIYYVKHAKWVVLASEAYARYLINEFLSRSP
ncbi:MAG: hypothetical protein ACFB0B_04165 [Thermonemataceae bacterium]